MLKISHRQVYAQDLAISGTLTAAFCLLAEDRSAAILLAVLGVVAGAMALRLADAFHLRLGIFMPPPDEAGIDIGTVVHGHFITIIGPTALAMLFAPIVGVSLAALFAGFAIASLLHPAGPAE